MSFMSRVDNNAGVIICGSTLVMDLIHLREAVRTHDQTKTPFLTAIVAIVLVALIVVVHRQITTGSSGFGTLK